MVSSSCPHVSSLLAEGGVLASGAREPRRGTVKKTMKAASGTLLVLLNARLLQQVECSMWSGHWLGKEFQHPGDREGFITHDKVSVTLIGDTGFYTIPAWGWGAHDPNTKSE